MRWIWEGDFSTKVVETNKQWEAFYVERPFAVVFENELTESTIDRRVHEADVNGSQTAQRKNPPSRWQEDQHVAWKQIRFVLHLEDIEHESAQGAEEKENGASGHDRDSSGRRISLAGGSWWHIVVVDTVGRRRQRRRVRWGGGRGGNRRSGRWGRGSSKVVEGFSGHLDEIKSDGMQLCVMWDEQTQTLSAALLIQQVQLFVLLLHRVFKS